MTDERARGTLDYMSYAMTLGDQTVHLADDVDITELKSEVVRNVHANGGWLALHTDRGETVEVFVSAGQYIRLASVATPGSGA